MTEFEVGDRIIVKNWKQTIEEFYYQIAVQQGSTMRSFMGFLETIGIFLLAIVAVPTALVVGTILLIAGLYVLVIIYALIVQIIKTIKALIAQVASEIKALFGH